MTKKKPEKKKRPAARAPQSKRRIIVTLRGVIEAVEDDFAKQSLRAGKERLWLLAEEYRVRETTCSMLVGLLTDEGIDVDFPMDVTDAFDDEADDDETVSPDDQA